MKVKTRKLSPAASAGVGVAIALVVAAAGWFLLISPQRARAAELDTQIAAVEQQIRAARLAAESAKDAEPIRVADLFRLTKAMPSDTDMAGVLLELSRVAAESGILFEQISPQPTLTVGAFRAQPISLVFTGDFYSLSDFLFRLRSLVGVQRGRLLANGRLFSVDKIQFVEGDEGFPHIKAILTVSAFLYGAGPVAGAPPAAPATTTTQPAPSGTETTGTDAGATTPETETTPPADDATELP